MMNHPDPLIPNTSTVWQLWHIDTFDLDSSPSAQNNGTDIIHGLYQLWLYTLKEGILDSGSASLSYFYLTWGNAAAARADVVVNPFQNLALIKLRRWVGFTPQAQENKGTRDGIVWRLAQLHDELLQQSNRWKASSIDWAAEAREILARVDSISTPEEL